MSETMTETVQTLNRGDRVRYCGNTIGEYQDTDRIGTMGTVEAEPFDDGTQVRVTWDDRTSISTVFTVNVAKVQTLNPGDRLRITEDNTASTHYTAGMTVEVIDLAYRDDGTLRSVRVQPVTEDDTLDPSREKFLFPTGEGWERLPVETDLFAPGEAIPVGTEVRVLPNPTTASGGGVYFRDVTQARVIAYYSDDNTGPDVRIARLDGDGPVDQSVGRQFLRKVVPVPDEPVAFLPDMVPAADLTAARERITALEAEVEAERTLRQRTIRQYVEEAERLSDLAIEAAVEHDMCGKYEDLVEAVESVNTYVTLKARPQEATFTGRRRIRVSVWVEESGTYDGHEGDDPDEDDFSWDGVNSYAIKDAVDHDYDVDYDDTTSFEFDED